MGKQKKQVYFEFAKGSKVVGRVVFELYYDISSQTAAYFHELITANKGKQGYLGT